MVGRLKALQMPPAPRGGPFLALLAASAGFFSAACGNYTSATRQAREGFYSGQYAEAAKTLEKGAHEEGVDQLLYALDRATALHHAGDYDESTKDFQLADKLSEIKDYTSLSAEAATAVANDKIIPYKGEDFERVLISQYLALNYLMKGEKEDALVECRRVNHKLRMMISQGKRKYKLNPMAMYLAALMYEDSGEWDDAYVDYQGVHKLAPDFPYLKEDLYRLAWRNRMPDAMREWAEAFHLSAADAQRIKDDADKPEIVVIIENGRSPEKAPNPAWRALPHYVPRENPVDHVDVSVGGGAPAASKRLFDVEKTAIENLDEKFAGILAKRVVGVVAKEVIADQVERRTNSPLLGAIARVGMYAADQADLRSWLTLPKDFQLVRIRLPAEAADQALTLKFTPRTSAGGVAAVSPPLSEKTVLLSSKNNKTKLVRSFVLVRVP